MARTYLRATAAAGALGLGLLAMSPAVAATGYQAGATALFIKIADQEGQGTGLVTATYENGQETKTGETEPAMPAPGGGFFSSGVLAQEATASATSSAACAGLVGDGGSVINIGESSCLDPGDTITGSFGDFSFSSLIEASTSQFPQELKTQLGLLDPTGELTTALDDALGEAQAQFPEGGLVANLEAIEGRCVATDGGAGGEATLTNARIALNIPGRDPLVLLALPAKPDPNTELFTDLSDVLELILDAVENDLRESFDGGPAPLTALTEQVRDNIVTEVRAQLEANLEPLEANLLKITLNKQDFPTPDSIKVRAFDLELLPAAKEQLDGNPVVNIQIGDAACAPVSAALVSPPQAGSPPVVAPPGLPETPTQVTSGLTSAPGDRIDTATWALLALAGLGLVAGAATGVRRLFD